MNKSSEQTIIKIVIIILICILFFTLSARAISKTELLECKKWEKQKAKYELFYSTDWQKAQCKNYDIEL